MATLVHRRRVTSPNRAVISSSNSGKAAWYPRVMCAAVDERIRLVEDGVGDGQRQVADGVAVDHVAEIDQPDDALVPRVQVRAAADQDVVVVGIVVDDAGAQPGQEGSQCSLSKSSANDFTHSRSWSSVIKSPFWRMIFSPLARSQ